MNRGHFKDCLQMGKISTFQNINAYNLKRILFFFLWTSPMIMWMVPKFPKKIIKNRPLLSKQRYIDISKQKNIYIY